MPKVTTESLYRITLQGLERMDKLEDTLDRINKNDKKIAKAVGFTAFRGKVKDGIAVLERFGQKAEQALRKVTAATKDLIDTASKFEVMNVQFETLLGSAEAAQDRMEELAAFSARTPFKLEGIAAASRILQTFGGDTLATGDSLQMVGDMAASVGTDFQELSTWVARMYDALDSGRPWGEAGLRLQELGILSGKNRAELEKMTKEGASGAEVWARFSETMTDNFGGGMERLSQTASGLLSTVQDNLTLIKKSIAEEGLFDVWKANLEAVLGLLGGIQETGATKEIGQQIAIAGINVSKVFWEIAIVGARLIDNFDVINRAAEFASNPPESGFAPERAFQDWMRKSQLARSIDWLVGFSRGLTQPGPTGPPSPGLEDLARSAQEEAIRSFQIILNTMIPPTDVFPQRPAAGGAGGFDLSSLEGQAGQTGFTPRGGRFQGAADGLDLLTDKTEILRDLSIDAFDAIDFAAITAYDTMKSVGSAGYDALMEASARSGAAQQLSLRQVSNVAKFAAREAAAAGIQALADKAGVQAKIFAAEALGLAFTNPAAAAGKLAAAAGLAAIAGVGTAVAASMSAGAESDFNRSLDTGGGFGGRTSGGFDRTGGGGRTSLPVTAQSAAPQNITYNLFVQHFGSTVYGAGGVQELYEEEFLPRLKESRANAEI